MAWLETIRLTRFRTDLHPCSVRRFEIFDLARPEFPQICWEDSRPWREVNQWLLSRLEDGKAIATLNSNARSLHAYAQWLETTGIDWLCFPVRRRDRCLVRYRGALCRAMESNGLRPSTAALRMNTVIRFYRWLRDAGLVPSEAELWEDRAFRIRTFDETGFVRMLEGTTTDLAISNRSIPGVQLEDGVLPLSSSERDKILAYAQRRLQAKTHTSISPITTFETRSCVCRHMSPGCSLVRSYVALGPAQLRD